MYTGALLTTLATSLFANIILSGYMLRFKRQADFYHEKFHDAVTKITPPCVDPYAQVKVEIGYPWDDAWD